MAKISAPVVLGIAVVGGVLLLGGSDAYADTKPKPKPKPKPGGGGGGGIIVPTDPGVEEPEEPNAWGNLSEEEWNRAEDALAKLENCGVGLEWIDHYRAMTQDRVTVGEPASGSQQVTDALDDLDFIAGKVCVLYDAGGTDTDPPPDSKIDKATWLDLLANPAEYYADLSVVYNDLLKSKNPWQVLELFRALKTYDLPNGVYPETSEHAKKLYESTALAVCRFKWTPENDQLQYVAELQNLYQLAYNADYEVFGYAAELLRECAYAYANNRNEAIAAYNAQYGQ